MGNILSSRLCVYLGPNFYVFEYSNPQKAHCWRKTRLFSKFGGDVSNGASCGRTEKDQKR